MKNYLNFGRLSVAILMVFHFNGTVNCQTSLNENFDYPAGSYLTANGWNAHSSVNVNAVSVASPGLVYPGYPSSDIGLSALLANNGEDVSKTFTSVTTGSAYCAFLVRVISFENDYFLHLAGTTVGNNYKGRVFTSGTGDSFDFGLSKGSGTPVYTTGAPYSTGITYLLVLKYTIAGGASNDTVSLYIITDQVPASEPDLPSIGPVADAGQTDLSNVSAVALRQYSSGQNILVDGIRVALTWEAVTGSVTGTGRQTIQDNLTLFPVPAIEDLKVSNTMNIKVIEIIDITGRVVITVKTKNLYEIRIPVSYLPRGLYFARFTTEYGRIIKKFIKE
jgi:hypothetical protein